MALCALRPSPRFPRAFPSPLSVASRSIAPQGLVLGVHLPSIARRDLRYKSILPLAASHEDSKHSEIEVEEKKNDIRPEESQEAWKETLNSFREQALKMQNISQEAYEIYARKAMVILKETSEQLKIHAEKARHDLSVVAKEITEEGKDYLSIAAEKSPEPVKEVVETFSSSVDDLNEISKLRDFYFGIPYGLLLSVGGFLSFMLTGSISAIRFGVILGGTLLALSISSMQSYKRGQSYALALKGQAVIAGIIFLRETRLLFQRPSFSSYFTTFFSGTMVALYMYRIKLNGEQSKGTNLEPGMEN